jgi:hypothetical protein
MAPPIVIAKVALGVIGMVFSAISLLITVIKFVVCYSIFFGILFLLSLQFLPFFHRYDVIGWLERLVDNSLYCEGIQPLGENTALREIPFRWSAQ